MAEVPYPCWTREQVALARALRLHGRWRWGLRTWGVLPDGREVKASSAAPSGFHGHPPELLPWLSHEDTALHVRGLLVAACEDVVAVGWSNGPDQEGLHWASIKWGAYRKTWTALSHGEAVGLALLDRWLAMDRAEERRGG